MKSLRQKRQPARRFRTRSLRVDSLEPRRLLAPVVEGDHYVVRVDEALEASWNASTEAVLHLEFGGNVYNFDDTIGGFEIGTYRFRNDIAIEYEDPGNHWYFNIEAINSQQLAVGLYDNATRFLYAEPGTPGLYVGGEGHTPGALTGWFEVHAVKYEGNNNPVGLEATFGIDTTGLTGHIRYVEPGYQSGVLVNDSTDGEGTLSAELVSSTAQGNLTFHTDGTFQYLPNAGFVGTDSFTYRAWDGMAYSDPVEVTIEVKAPNVNPIAVDDKATTGEDMPILIDLLANDSDPNGDPLAVTWVSNLPQGTAEITEDGKLLFTPPENFSGSITFFYRIADGWGGTDLGNVTITMLSINDMPVAADDLAKTVADRPVEIDILTNDTDVEGDTLTVGEVTEAAHGSVTINANGTLTYTPEAGFFGTDRFTYTIYDGQGGTATAEVEIVVRETNAVPVGTAEQYHVLVNGLLEANWHGPVDSLLWIESDPGDPIGQGQTYQYTDEEGNFRVYQIYPTHGDVSIGFSGQGDDWTISLVAPEGVPLEVGRYENATRFPSSGTNLPEMWVSGNGRGENTVTGWFEVHAVQYDSQGRPIGLDASFEQNGGLRGRVRYVRPGIEGGVLVNDTDADGDPLTALLASGPSHGTLDFRPDGTFTYVPDPDFTGTDSFSYVVWDGFDQSQPIEVVLTVAPPNAKPVARYDAVSALQETPVQIDLLQNDTDPDGDPLTVVEVTQPAHGTVVLGEGGTVTYTPDVGFTGPDSFRYTIEDGRGGIVSARVDVTVRAANEAPTGNHDYYAVPLNEELVVSWAAGQESVLVIESDPGDYVGQGQDWFFHGGMAEFTLGQSYSNYNDLTIRVEGTDYDFRIILDAPDQERLEVGLYENAYRFPYQGGNTPGLSVSGNGRGCNTLYGEFEVHAVEYDAAGQVIGIDASFVQHCEMEETKLEGRIHVAPADSQSGVLANDTDGEADRLSAELVSTTSHGTLTFHADGTFHYVPDADYVGFDTFTYVVKDNLGSSEPVTVILNVGPLNVAEDDAVITDEDRGIVINLTQNDKWYGETPPSLLSVGQPNHGTVSWSPESLLIYSPHENFHGTDTFTYRIDDGFGGYDEATVTVTVLPVNDRPVVTINHIDGVREVGEELVISASGTDVEDPSSSLQYSYFIKRLGQNEPPLAWFGTDLTSVLFTPEAAGDYQVTIAVYDSEGGFTWTQQTITIGDVSHFEFVFSENLSQPVGSIVPAGTTLDTVFNEWEDVTGQLWVTVDADLAGQTVDLSWKLAVLEDRFGQPQLLDHLGTEGGWTHTQQAGMGLAVATLSDVDFSGYEVGDRVLVATVLIPRNPDSVNGVSMDNVGHYPEAVENDVIQLWGVESTDVAHSFGIDADVTGYFTPVVFDADDNGRIGLSDFVRFASAFGQSTSESPLAYRYDYDGSGRVGLSDLMTFIRHFGLDTSDGEFIEQPVVIQFPPQTMTYEGGLVFEVDHDPEKVELFSGIVIPDYPVPSLFIDPTSSMHRLRSSAPSFETAAADSDTEWEALLLESHARSHASSVEEAAVDAFWDAADEEAQAELLDDLDDAALTGLWT